MRRHELFWFAAGIAAYWAVQHFTGLGTSGLGARQSPGGLQPPSGS